MGTTVYDGCSNAKAGFGGKVKLPVNRCFYIKSNTSAKYLGAIPGFRIRQEAHGGLASKIESLLSLYKE